MIWKYRDTSQTIHKRYATVCKNSMKSAYKNDTPYHVSVAPIYHSYICTLLPPYAVPSYNGHNHASLYDEIAKNRAKYYQIQLVRLI